VVQEWTAKQGLVAAGLGITLVPGLAAGALRPDILVKRLRAEETTSRPIHAATRPGPSPAAARFIEFLTSGAARLRAELTDIMAR
jgi:DNA-binding transcriptional LysR family regulator